MIHRIILLSALLLGGHTCMSQQTNRRSKSERIQYFAKELSVDNVKAAEIVAALDFNEEKLQQAFKDRALKPRDRQQLISRLAAEKRAKVNAVLTEKQKEVFNSLFITQINRSRQVGSDLKKKNEEQLAKPGMGAVLKRKN